MRTSLARRTTARGAAGQDLIEMQNFRNTRNQLAYACLPTSAAVAATTSRTARFPKRKIDEYEALRIEIEQREREMGE